MFPDDDESWRDADSIDMLRTVIGTLPAAAAQRRRDGDLRAAAARPLQGGDGAGAGRGDRARVSVKATSNEGMGWIGRGEGIACIAVAMLEDE